jgi:hypothetical protein
MLMVYNLFDKSLGGMLKMSLRKIKFLSAFMVLIFGVMFLAGCPDAPKSEQEKKPAARQEEVQPVSAADQEAFKQKIAKLGIPIYKGATFVEVKKKSKDSTLLVAVYEVPAQREKDYDKVKSYYAAGLQKALVPKGWAAGKAADNVILYRKGFEIFYVEFSRIIIPPDTKKIRIAFQYGG